MITSDMSDMSNIQFDSVSTQPAQLTNEASASQTLSCFEMWIDGIKAVKRAFDPLSDAVACVAGTLCCVATVVAQAEENSRPATRGDVVYANQRRRQDAQEMGCAFATGACLGDAIIDSAAIILGGMVSAPRAIGLTLFNNNLRANPVFSVSREDIDAVELASSCAPVTGCCN